MPRWPCRRARRPRAGRSSPRCVEWLLEQKVERRDVVVALGGGVIGDLVGFAAAVLRRGVRFVQVPTTLLAQVDSSVGGKTGINTAQGKNLVGAFHQPRLVLADIDVLDTLARPRFPGRLWRGGEIRPAGRCALLRLAGGQRPGHGAPATRALRQHAVRRSVEMKAGIVSRDETEEGERALLNLGHTFCHALEKATGYSDRLLHGEGVAIGCALAFELSQRLGLCAQEAPSRVRAHLRAMGMKVDHRRHSRRSAGRRRRCLALMAQDKKVIDGRLRFILARGIGEAFVAEDVPGRRGARPAGRRAVIAPRRLTDPVFGQGWNAPTRNCRPRTPAQVIRILLHVSAARRAKADGLVTQYHVVKGVADATRFSSRIRKARSTWWCSTTSLSRSTLP